MNQFDKDRLDRLEGKVDDIKDNHLSHIYDAIGNLNGKLWVLIPIVLSLVGLIIGLYVKGG
jgi:hypothetical protein